MTATRTTPTVAELIDLASGRSGVRAVPKLFANSTRTGIDPVYTLLYTDL